MVRLKKSLKSNKREIIIKKNVRDHWVDKFLFPINLLSMASHHFVRGEPSASHEGYLKRTPLVRFWKL
jgi:hypothetical protein